MNIFEHKLIDGLKIDYEGSFEDFADEFEKIIGVRPQRVYPTSIPRELVEVAPPIVNPMPIMFSEFIYDNDETN
jgi:hypothetical protein